MEDSAVNLNMASRNAAPDELAASISPAIESLLRGTYRMLCAIGRPIGGVRPRRVYHALARRAYTRPDFRWTRNRWGHELYLSPHYHLDFEIISFGTYDISLHRFIERHVQPGMYCADVGANMGEVALHMAKCVGSDGRVFAFEPVPHLFRKLTDNVFRNHLQATIDARQLAVLDKPTTVVIDHPTEDAVNQGLGSIMNSPRTSTSRQTAVEGTSLDDFIRREAVPRLDFLKLDIQGAEYLLLDGARETLTRFSPDFVMEISPLDLAPAGLTSRDLMARAEERGYQIYALDDGRIGARLRSAAVADDFAASNVFCTKR
jgi:FkbM family methyltransferase